MLTSHFDGTVLTVHDIAAMEIYIDNLEYKEAQIKGEFAFNIQTILG